MTCDGGHIANQPLSFVVLVHDGPLNVADGHAEQVPSLHTVRAQPCGIEVEHERDQDHPVI